MSARDTESGADAPDSRPDRHPDRRPDRRPDASPRPDPVAVPVADPVAVAGPAHDHGACLDRIEAAVAARSRPLTPIRRRVLEILTESHHALGAYDILGRLAADGAAAQPPVAYRALHWLQEAGFVHRVERLNAYVACCHPDGGHHAALLVCRNCRLVAEAPAPDPAGALLGPAAAAAGFAVEDVTLEALGICAACRAGDDGAGPGGDAAAAGSRRGRT